MYVCMYVCNEPGPIAYSADAHVWDSSASRNADAGGLRAGSGEVAGGGHSVVDMDTGGDGADHWDVASERSSLGSLAPPGHASWYPCPLQSAFLAEHVGDVLPTARHAPDVLVCTWSVGSAHVDWADLPIAVANRNTAPFLLPRHSALDPFIHYRTDQWWEHRDDVRGPDEPDSEPGISEMRGRWLFSPDWGWQRVDAG